MTNTTREILETYQIRKSKKQKTAFLDYAKAYAESLGYSAKIEKGAFGVRNLVVGDVDSAKVVYGAHYDTCSVLPFPNFITPKSFGLYMLYQLALVAVIFAVAFGIGFLGGAVAALTDAWWTGMISPVVYILVVLLLFGGPANKHTANDNTSGITVLLDMLTELPADKRDAAAFVFFDLEEAGLFGSSAFAAKHKKAMKNKLLVNFDCVSDGENMLLILKKKARVHAAAFEEAYASKGTIQSEIVTKNIFYPSDQANFPMGVGAAAFRKKGKILYLGRIHTKKDTVYRKENIEFLKDGSIRLLDLV